MAKKSARRIKGVPPPPKCKAILLCDKVIIEHGTKKASIIGIFDQFELPKLPGHTRPCTLFIQLVDGQVGRYELVVEMHDLAEDTIIARAPTLAVQWQERLSRLNVIMPIPPLPLQHAGQYDLVVFANDQEIDRQKFEGKTIPTRHADEPSSD